ncbi:hypothetical protein QWY93_00420 [Echinicola jeungdonensis]|uniref:Uncharacterized protein n=1 Tax=Echinicola jeungdonensis TaxID=709343 RepID=A0ABV5J2A3_9BACT|nr:hypothetical protein [Echinicola jeungdonensis]MDN3667805.1 hypothetical protein [Echinicola jeungdonensis]
MAIVFFILNSLVKKKGDKQGNGEEESNGEEQAPKRQKSFEELLQEIRGEQQQREEDFEETGQKEIQEKKGEAGDGPKEFYPTEDSEKEKEPSEIKYYEGTYHAEDKEGEEKLKKLEDQVDLRSEEKILGDVEDITRKESQSSRYKQLLRNPENLRESIVVSEILKRRHF